MRRRRAPTSLSRRHIRGVLCRGPVDRAPQPTASVGDPWETRGISRRDKQSSPSGRRAIGATWQGSWRASARSVYKDEQRAAGGQLVRARVLRDDHDEYDDGLHKQQQHCPRATDGDGMPAMPRFRSPVGWPWLPPHDPRSPAGAHGSPPSSRPRWLLHRALLQAAPVNVVQHPPAGQQKQSARPVWYGLPGVSAVRGIRHALAPW